MAQLACEKVGNCDRGPSLLTPICVAVTLHALLELPRLRPTCIEHLWPFLAYPDRVVWVETSVNPEP